MQRMPRRSPNGWRWYRFGGSHPVQGDGDHSTASLDDTLDVTARAQVADGVGEASVDARAHGHPRSRFCAPDELNWVCHGLTLCALDVDPLGTGGLQLGCSGRDRGDHRMQVATAGEAQYSGCRVVGAEHGDAALPKFRLDASGIRVGE